MHFLFDLQWITPVHDLNQQCTSSKPDLVIIFFHGIGLGKNDEWKETWTSITSDGKRLHWPQEWLPAHLATKNGNNVRIFSQRMGKIPSLGHVWSNTINLCY
jgi:hypothetical protein